MFPRISSHRKKNHNLCLSFSGHKTLSGIYLICRSALCASKRELLSNARTSSVSKTSIFPVARKGVAFHSFLESTSECGRKELGCPSVTYCLDTPEIRTQFSRDRVHSPTNLSLHLMMGNSVLTWKFHRSFFLLPVPSLNYKQLGFLDSCS